MFGLKEAEVNIFPTSVKIIIPMEPVVMKNRQTIRRVRRGTKLVPSIDYRNEVYQAFNQGMRLLEQVEIDLKHAGRLPVFPPGMPLNMTIISGGPWKKSSKRKPDASNLYEFPQDLLEKKGIIENDNQIQSHNGSNRICLCDDCPQREKIIRGPRKGELKDGCPHRKRVPKTTATGRMSVSRKTGKIKTVITACPCAYILIILRPWTRKDG